MGVSKRTRQREMKKNLVAVMIIALFAVIVFSVNSIGKFIAQKVISPISELSGNNTESVSTDTVKTEKTELYAKCIGSFDSLEEAEEKAEGNYIFNFDNKFNVLSSIHTAKEEALSSGDDLFTLSLDGISLKITGTKTQKEIVSSSVSLMAQSAMLLPEFYEKLSSGKMTSLQVLSKITTLKSELLQKLEELKTLDGSNQTVEAFKDMLTLSSSLLDKIDEKDLPETLRYVACAYACEYFCFLDNLE